MVDSEYSMDTYKSVEISIGTVMINPKMLKFVPNHLKTKKICKHGFKKCHICSWSISESTNKL